MKKILAVILGLVLSAAYADLKAQVLSKFSLTNVVNNEAVSLESYPSCQGIVLIFTSNSCPYDEYYRKRIQALAETYHDKVPLLLVNAHTDPDESLNKMAAKGKALNLTMPYLSDKEQTLASRLSVRKSPEAFLLKNDDGKFTVVYRGAIDDNAQVEADVRHHYLRDAIDIMLTNQKIATPEVRPVGCNLKKASGP
jgi:thioredoxin-related protein